LEHRFRHLRNMHSGLRRRSTVVREHILAVKAAVKTASS